MKTVSFILPPATRNVVGGLKVVYQYANYLVENGYRVELCYLLSGKNMRKIPEWICKGLRKAVMVIEPRWFTLDKRVVKRSYENINDVTCDVMIATSVDTAEVVVSAKNCNGRKLYFIQGFEEWGHTAEYVKSTYSMGMIPVVVSKWLKEIVDRESQIPAIYIPNGIDLNVFKPYTLYKERELILSMLFHYDEKKGCDVGLRVINKLKKDFPELRVILFGSPPKPKELPEWIEYYSKAKQEKVAEIYNRSRVFLCTSRQEGYGLTGLEALACGCALVTTNCKGIMEYAIAEENAIICEVDDEDSLLNSLKDLLNNRECAERMSKNGQMMGRNYDQKISREKFKRLIDEIS